MKDLLKQEAGFTLLELIVVVAVIGILAAIIVPQVNNIQGDAEENSAKSSLASIQTALERYKLAEDQGDGSYPAQSSWASDLGVDGSDFVYINDDDTSQYLVYYDTGFDIDGEADSDDYYYVDSNQSGVQTKDDSTPEAGDI